MKDIEVKAVIEEREKPDRLIVNSPYEEPARHWRYNPETRLFALVEGRREAGYIIASERSKSYDDPGQFVTITLVNQIRPRVKAWRAAGYPGVTGITKRLLEHWRDPQQRDLRFFFCQLEAIETLIWLAETAQADKTGLLIPGDGGPFRRLCSKMATGSGKTIVMAMLIAWQVINKVTYPQDARFAKNALVIAPGLTVRNRLQVLQVAGEGNYYRLFNVVPDALLDKLRQGKVLIRNWHALQWDTAADVARRRSVDKRGPKSDEAYAREVLGEMATARNLIVINDEGHHAWRVPAESKVKGVAKADIEEATKWVGGLDRIHQARGILTAYDFSATPFAPSGKKSSDEALFGWIVSDFGLNDAIESGLVKTPRVVIRDDAVPDARTYKSRLYHIYKDPEVHNDLNRRARPEEPLPDLVLNAYYVLGYDWREAARSWAAQGYQTPPVMITVCNRTETAARVKFAFDRRKIHIDELSDPARTLHIDSRVLDEAEAQEEPLALTAATAAEEEVDESDETDDEAAPARKWTKKEQAEHLRKQVDTIGRVGQVGEQIQNIISVGMLSEGWDAKTVTHIMGLRAFSSQLLCEQVVGRGLRRTSYDVNKESGLFDPEYVNIFGVPFTFLPHEDVGSDPPPPPGPKTEIRPEPGKAGYAIRWPNIERIEHIYRPKLTLDWSQIAPLELSAANTVQLVELAPVLDGKPDIQHIAEIDLESLSREFRYQKIIFEAARDVYDQMQHSWPGNREYLLAQLVRLVEQFIRSDKINITPALFNRDDARRRLMITLNMTRVVQHIWEAIRFSNTERLEPIFNRERPILSTGDMNSWYTGKPVDVARRSHINYVVLDSTWESAEAFELDHNPGVAAWAKNDHLGFEINYMYRGVVRKYRPDYLVRLRSGEHVILETKGDYNEEAKTKERFLNEWIDAVNTYGEFGRWHPNLSLDPADIKDLLARYSS